MRDMTGPIALSLTLALALPGCTVSTHSGRTSATQPTRSITSTKAASKTTRSKPRALEASKRDGASIAVPAAADEPGPARLRRLTPVIGGRQLGSDSDD